MKIITDIIFIDEELQHSSWTCPKKCPFSVYRYGDFGFQVCQLNCNDTQLKYNKILKKYERSQQCRIAESLTIFWQNYHHIVKSKYKSQKIKITSPHVFGEVVDNKILGFKEKYGFLSNFYPCNVEYEGLLYPSVQHAYQAAKTFNIEMRTMIKNLKNGFEAKKAGNSLQVRIDWQYVKFDIMEQLIKYKFSNDFELLGQLLQTGNMKLIECNNWNDQCWGMTFNKTTEEYIGSNALGQILMKVRKQIYEVGS